MEKLNEEKKIKEICTAKRRHRKQMVRRERADRVNKYKRDSEEGIKINKKIK
jgi:hypothetical protein